MKNSAILAIGREIIFGSIRDTNSSYLASYLSKLGIYNRFIISTDDIKEDIIGIIKYVWDKVDIIISTGGLGPTFDDITIESVAEAVGEELYLDEAALDFVRKFYTKLYKEGKINSAKLNEKRKKMAYLIKGCKPLLNRTGAAWGIYLRKNNKHIFCLPGIPSEMKPMFENEVLPILKDLSDRTIISKTYRFNINDESVLGKIIDKLIEKYDVYIKSLPADFNSAFMNVRFTSIAKTETEAMEKIENAKKELDKSLKHFSKN